MKVAVNQNLNLKFNNVCQCPCKKKTPFTLLAYTIALSLHVYLSLNAPNNVASSNQFHSAIHDQHDNNTTHL
jgi:hypothetical protein